MTIYTRLQIYCCQRTKEEPIGQQWTQSSQHVFGNGLTRPLLDSSSATQNTNGVYNPGLEPCQFCSLSVSSEGYHLGLQPVLMTSDLHLSGTGWLPLRQSRS